ncbi:heterokaryon incompatibility protein-domain-containing protein [Daldinia sp. FL1419]|nr:heterokaryon incompatibility protein-domain-containing protein [Daldinia sp. FL1419]
MARYKYQDLQDGRSFRLLSLLPSNDLADPIRCQLQVHSLTEDGQILHYTALSYVWGDPSFDSFIECEGGILPINRGCFQALRSLRDSLRDTNKSLAFTPYFWVDAVCINQSDEREKSIQVQLMGDIYRSAETVLCFVGDSYSQEDLYVSNCLGSKAGSRRHFLRRDLRPSGGWMADRDILGANNLRESAVRKLFESQYWTRLWTFQEALLSHRKIVFLGTDMIEWESVGTLLQQAAVVKREGISHLLPKAIHFHSLTTTSPMLRLLLDGNSVNSTKGFNKTYTQSLSLEIRRILSFSSELKTSDPRDKIYALVGVMAALEVDLGIDYSRPLALIYKDSFSAFSMKACSFQRWTPKTADVSFAFLHMGPGNSFHKLHSLPVRTKGSVTRSQATGSRKITPKPTYTVQYLHWGEDMINLPLNKVVPNIIPNETWSTKVENGNCSGSDDETESTISSHELGELSYLSLAHSLARSFSIRKRNWLISRVSVELGPVLSQCTRDGGNTRCQQTASCSNGRADSQGISPTSQRPKSHRRSRDQDDHSDDEGNQEHPRKKNKGSDVDDIKKLLACPFHQREPRRPSINRSCTGPGWASIARLKEHLYRVHFVHRCRRCKSRFITASELDQHYEALIPCMASSAPADPMEGFNENQREGLKCRRVQDWKKIYQILFPDDDENTIPSQYYASVITIADILDQFDRAYQEEAERQLPGRVRSVLEGLSSRPNYSIQDEIMLMINDINNTVISSFRQRMEGVVLGSPNPAPSEDSVVTPSRVEPNLDNPASFFLEYLNNIDNEYNMSHSLDSQPGFDYNTFQSSTGPVYTDEQNRGFNTSPPMNLLGTYDGVLHAPTIIRNEGINNTQGHHTSNRVNNREGDSADEWTVVEAPPEESP